MLLNYLKIAIRQLTRNKVFSLINIAGLAIGLACSMLIFLWVLHELSYDRFHNNYQNIYRIGYKASLMGKTLELPLAMGPLATSLREEFPEVKNVVRIENQWNVSVLAAENSFILDQILVVDSTFFDMFNFHVITGNAASTLNKPFSIVLTEDTALKLYGKENPVGKTIRIRNQRDYTITGVVANPPANTHFSFDALTSLITDLQLYPKIERDWLTFNYFTYIEFFGGTNRKEFLSKLDDLNDRKFGEDASSFGLQVNQFLMPLSSIHLNSNSGKEIKPGGNKTYILIFSAISLFLLLIACTNFMNLSTARSSMRSREVGLRKVVGATRTKLIVQFLGESVLIAFLAFILALLLIELMSPLFDSLTGISVSLYTAPGIQLMPFLPILILVVGAIAGSYPAIYLSAFNPIKTLKGDLGSHGKKYLIRNALIIFQLFISVCLIVCTLVVFEQMKFLKNKDLGINKEDKLLLHLFTTDIRRKHKIIKQELSAVHGVKAITSVNNCPGISMNQTAFLPEGVDEGLIVSCTGVDHEFLEVLEISLSEGRSFSKDFSTDSLAVIINKTAAKRFGWENTSEKTIGKITGNNEWTNYRVIGMTEDFHIRSLHEPLEPLILLLLQDNPSYQIISIEEGMTAEAIQGIKEKWEELNPDSPFLYQFLTDVFEGHYNTERRLSKMFLIFTLFALFVAALGLYGLAYFTVDSRTKEIGIRKSMGATPLRIMTLLTREYSRWVLIANLTGWPVAYLIMQTWLMNFSYQTSLNNPFIYLMAGLITLLTALIAVNYQTLKASRINPARTLKYE